MAGGAYDDLIMEHIRNARNFRVPDAYGIDAVGKNPMCGDEMRVYVRVDGDRIDDIGFQCECCGISMASASIMTEAVKGKGVDEARALAADYRDLIESRSAGEARDSNERAAILDTLTRFPSRTRCAALGWSTLLSALDKFASK